MQVFAGLLIPFAGTALGSAMVFFMRGMHKGIEKLLLGFASGVMIAASVWSLLIPAIDMAAEQGQIAWVPAAGGFGAGMAFLLVLDILMKKASMLVLAVTLHNIPEGMSVGVTFAGALIGDTGITMAGAFALAVGIAVQNFPEGAIISMPLRGEGISKRRAFFYGALSGIVEPIGAFITILLAEEVVSALPVFLAFAAGAMIYVVVGELIPEAQAGERSYIGTVGVAVGFVIMMILDVGLV